MPERHAYLWTNKGPRRANFCGPGTKLDKRLARGDKPVNYTDSICLEHDKAYRDAKTHDDIRFADRRMVQRLQDNRVPATEGAVMTAALRGKMLGEDVGAFGDETFTDLPGLHKKKEVTVAKKKNGDYHISIYHPKAGRSLPQRPIVKYVSKPPMAKRKYQNHKNAQYQNRVNKRYRSRTAGLTRFVPAFGGTGRTGRVLEKKFLDTVVTDIVVPATMVLGTDFLTVVAGVGESQRIGRMIVVKNIRVRGCLVLSPKTSQEATNGDRLRVVMYLDKQANGALATSSVLFQSDTIDSFRNVENITRFKFLYDKTFVFNHPAGAGDGSSANDWIGLVRNFKINLRCNIPIEYASTTGVIAERCCNNIGFAFISETGGSGLQTNVRVRFVG